MKKEVENVISTDISRDGMLQGPAIQLYREILEQNPGIYLIASGGVGSVQDILDLEKIGIPAVIVGKAIYEGKISPKEIRRINTFKY
jgi:phosphoribosylformimino-5-aminoimidazole carboxamide ribotide isomerase